MTETISNFLRDRIAAGDFPSAAYAVADGAGSVIEDAVGRAVVEPEEVAAGIDTIYDLASLTKPLVAGLLSAVLIERGALRTRDRVADHLTEFAGAEKRSITVGQLLTHTSGLAAWLPLYLIARQPSEVVKVIAGRPLDCGPGEKVVYSDLNYIVIGALIEKITGQPLDEFAAETIFVPLGLRDTSFNPRPDLVPRIAASETGNFYEEQVCIESGWESEARSYPFRRAVIRGQVHDGNCFFMGGIAGHAGLFSTARETLSIARQFLARQTILLRPETCQLFCGNLTPGLNEARSVGFQLAATPESTAGSALDADSFGHLGFTGTSVWIEPRSGRIFVLLTNRTHGRRPPFVNINSVRREFNSLASKALPS